MIPQGIAFALVAKMPPEYGLYSGFIPSILYAFWGSCGQLSIGNVASMSLICFQAAGPYYPDMDTDMEQRSDYIELVVLMCFQIGALQLLFGALNLGFISHFLSHPVIEGYKAGIFLTVSLTQLKCKNTHTHPHIQCHITLYIHTTTYPNALPFIPVAFFWVI